MYEERPIWSQNLLRYHSKIRLNSLKVIMPCVAIYLKNGPWRMLWIKYGYDPRKEPEARIYQTLDFRLRHQGKRKNVLIYFYLVTVLIGKGDMHCKDRSLYVTIIRIV